MTAVDELAVGLVPAQAQQGLATSLAEAQEVVEYLRMVTISTAEDYAEGAEQLREVKGRIKALEQEKKRLLDPLKIAQKQISALVDAPLETFKQAERIMKAALTAFDERREAEAIKKMQEAAAQGAEGDAEQALATLNEIEVTPEVRGVSFKTLLDFEVEDQLKVPQAYLQVNRAAVLAALRTGIEIPGIKVVHKRTMAVRT